MSGKGAPAALYSAFAGELVRGRTFRRRYTSVRSTPAGVLTSMNTILHQRQLEEYYCTLCYASFDFKRRVVTLANSGLPYPIRVHGRGLRPDRSARRAARDRLPGTTYDEVTFSLAPGDVYVICSDGIFEAMNEQGEEFTAAPRSSRSSSARATCPRGRSSTPSSRRCSCFAVPRRRTTT